MGTDRSSPGRAVRRARTLVEARTLRRMDELLARAFGPRGWWPARSVFEMMVGAILTQNANWTNVERAIANLRAAGSLSLGAVLPMRPSALARLIRPAGYFRVKAKRLRALCRWFDARAAGDARRLRRVETAALREELLGVHGVGRETADSILLYGLARPVFVVDAYTRRVLARHGLIAGTEDYDEIRASFEAAFAPPRRLERFNELHARIVELAKTHCRARARCADCPLAGWESRGMVDGSPRAAREAREGIACRRSRPERMRGGRARPQRSNRWPHGRPPL